MFLAPYSTAVQVPVFERLFPHVGAAIYVVGIVSFVATRLFGLPVTEMPDALHVVIALAAGVAGVGFLVHFRRILARRRVEVVLYTMMTGHLLLSSALHVWSLVTRSNEWIGLFPDWYPYLATTYFALFAWLCWRFPRTGPTVGRSS